MKKLYPLLIIAAVFILASCSKTGENADSPGTGEYAVTTEYASGFRTEKLENGAVRILIGEEEYFLVPEGEDVPDGVPESAVILKQPLDNIYLASSSAMDLFLKAGGIGSITMTSTEWNDWTIPEIKEKVKNDDIMYVGRYSAPDYEVILDEGCDLAVENTMIYHSPKTKEQLERLGIPVLVERSSYEEHPLGRLEWIKLYGLLTGNEAEAGEFFDSAVKSLQDLEKADDTGKKVAVFYIASSGLVNVRRPGDYISRMIEMAGGEYFMSEAESGTSTGSTLNMQMEMFYEKAKDADILIYNSTVDTELETIESLIGKSSVLSGMKAVKNGEVYCTGQNMFQQVSATADIVIDLNNVIAGNGKELRYIHKLR